MQNLRWDANKNKWKGPCPRCGLGGFFDVNTTSPYAHATLDVLHCPEDHIFAVEYITNSRPAVLGVYPIEHKGDIPPWLPDEFRSTYEEMLEAFSRRKYRSMIALCGLLLEANVNQKLTVEGDKKKSLFERIRILKTQGKIDTDQFSDATITRVTRNDMFHPEELLADVLEEDAKNAMQAVTSYLEREYKFRSSRALSAPNQGAQI